MGYLDSFSGRLQDKEFTMFPVPAFPNPWRPDKILYKAQNL